LLPRLPFFALFSAALCYVLYAAIDISRFRYAITLDILPRRREPAAICYAGELPAHYTALRAIYTLLRADIYMP